MFCYLKKIINLSDIINISIKLILICVLIICAAWCYHNKLIKQSTITVNELSDDFIYLSQESYTKNIDHVFSFKYNLKCI